MIAGVTGLALGVLAVAAAAVPPPLPGGFTDGSGAIGIFEGAGGSAIAVQLATGTTAWTDPAGRWPLASTAGWVAVAAPDAADPAAFRVRFLRPADGRLLRESRPVRIAGWYSRGEAIADESGLTIGTMRGSLVIRGRVGTARRGRKALRLFWVARSFTISGIRPSDPIAPPVSGVVTVDPVTGTIGRAPTALAAALDPQPALPAGWRPVPGRMYWRGGAWSDRPVPFRMNDGITGWFSSNASPESMTLVLHRRRGLTVRADTDIARGGSYVPDLSLDGRFLILHDGTRNAESHRLFDLERDGGPLVDLGWRDPPIRPPFVVRGPRLLCMREARGERADQRTVIRRSLNALDWKTGTLAWTVDLAPRFEDDPIPGSR